LVIGVVAIIGAGSACGPRSVPIDFSRTEASPRLNEAAPDKAAPLRFAVAPVLSPRPTSGLYQQMSTYIGTKLHRPVELVQGKTYSEINDLVASGDVTVAIVCTNPYLQGRDDFGMELVAAPEVQGRPVYDSLLVVSRNSTATSLADLRGASFAFTDPLSNSGRLVPTYQLALLGKKPDSFFSQTLFTYSHDSSVRAVADGVVAGAAVDSLVYDYLAATEPGLTEQVKVIERWGPFGINPVVVSPRLDPTLKAGLTRVFLEMDGDPEGKALLRSLFIDRFIVPSDKIYDSVRDMRSYLRERGLTP
jgi:phosphate/phosphite/phosphonate ABC transporter binding protein